MLKAASILGVCFLATVVVSGDDWPVSRPAPKSVKSYFVFLNTGKNRSAVAGLTQAQLAQLQTDHVGNITRLANLGVCMMAGPLGDNGFIRGTLVLTAKSMDEVHSYFKPDPFVEKGILDVEAYEMRGDMSSFKKHEEPFALANFGFAIFKRGPNWKSGQTMFSNVNHWKSTQGLAFHATISGSKSLTGIAYFGDPLSDGLKAAVAAEPSVKNGVFVVEWHPQLAAKGVLRRP